jgi:pSer/pThr/pTyr-binding forkhead associated (FHA) protein
VILIGRHLECDVRLDSPKISRRHCCVAIAYDRVVIRDLGSQNQIRVNGQVVEEARLQSGDEVAIGPLLYRLEPIEERRTGAPSRSNRPTSVGYPAVAQNSLFPGPDPESQLFPLDEF